MAFGFDHGDVFFFIITFVLREVSLHLPRPCVSLQKSRHDSETLKLLTINKIYCMEHLLYNKKRGDLASSVGSGFFL